MYNRVIALKKKRSSATQYNQTKNTAYIAYLGLITYLLADLKFENILYR